MLLGTNAILIVKQRRMTSAWLATLSHHTENPFAVRWLYTASAFLASLETRYDKNMSLRARSPFSREKVCLPVKKGCAAMLVIVVRFLESLFRS